MEIINTTSVIKLKTTSTEYDISKDQIVRIDRKGAFVWIITSESYAGSKPSRIYSADVTVPALGGSTDEQKAINLQNLLQTWVDNSSEGSETTLLEIAERIGATDSTVTTDPSSTLGGLNALLKGLVSMGSVLGGYSASDLDTAGDPKYYGFVNPKGEWYIIQETTATETFRYCKGTSGYETAVTGAWVTRAAKTYDYFHNIF